MTKILKVKLVDFGIDRVRYHDRDLEENSIVTLFQNADKILKEFSNKINNIITNDKHKVEFNEYTNRDIEIYINFN